MNQPIVLYDGVCGLCNRAVRFVLKRDHHDRFRFAPLQSEFAAEILQRHGVQPGNLDTFYLVTDHEQPCEQLSGRSDAAIALLRELGGIWAVAALPLRVLPRLVRNWGYNLVARNRCRVFGKYDVCPLPETKDRHKFLDQ